jgi:hypothetical protein
MPKSRTHAKRRAKQKRKKAKGNEHAKQAQAKEPREKYSIDDLAGRT